MSVWSSESNVGSTAINVSIIPNVVYLTTAVATLMMYKSYRSSLPNNSTSTIVRPDLVLDALEHNKPLYYFGVGSNLSRKKLEGRSICGKKIHVLSMEPCVIPNHRLAFNTRGFPPLEPAMGSLEPLPSFYETAHDHDDDDGGGDKLEQQRRLSKALKSYEREECHGALIKLSAEDYERVYQSEGGGTGPLQPYDEIVVTCIPYNKAKRPVKAVAFRAREHCRLTKDPCPSRRYMNIIKEGAQELGLRPCYLRWLDSHPTQNPPGPLLKSLAINSMVFTLTLNMVLKIRIVSHVQYWMLYNVYVPPTEARSKQLVGGILAGIIMFPAACFGVILRVFLAATGKMPKRFQKFIDSLNE